MIPRLRPSISTARVWDGGSEVVDSPKPCMQTVENGAYVRYVDMEPLITAARAVVACWEHGNLAGAVRQLAGALKEIEQ